MLGTNTISHYRILKALGSGGMGEVYLARDLDLDREVALKVIRRDANVDEETKRRFRIEARLAARLNHPNICTIYEIGETTEGVLFIAMEFADGQPLDEWLEMNSADTHLVLAWGVQVAAALEEAHVAGVVHRDIKPANLVLTRKGTVLVLDFGLAKVTESAHRDIRNSSELSTGSAPRSLVGTLPYMSPEQVLGLEIDHRTDIFSLGATLYELATGQVPFPGETLGAVCEAICHHDPVPASFRTPRISRHLDPILNQALAKNPEARQQSASVIREELLELGRSLAGEESGRSRPPTPSDGDGFLPTLEVRSSWGQKRSRRLPLPPDREHHLLVVLPFTGIGTDPATEPFCDGLVETLASKLTDIEQVSGAPAWVIPPSEVRAQGVDTATEAYLQFGATLVVSGSVQRLGDEIRVTLNLIDPTVPRQIESHVLTEHRDSGAFIQDVVVGQVSDMLGLPPGKAPRRRTKRGTSGPIAEDFYLQGTGYLTRFSDPRNIDTAISLFDQALEVDRRSPTAWAGLAEAYFRKFDLERDTRWATRALESCDRAIAIDDRIPSVHATIGNVYRLTGRLEEAIFSFRRALDLDPHFDRAYRGLARLYEKLDRLEEAEATYHKAIELRPDYWDGYNILGAFYCRFGRIEEALPQFEHVIRLTPDNHWGYNNLGSLYFALDRLPEAEEMFRKAFAISGDGKVASNIGTLRYWEGHFVEAAEWFEKALAADHTDDRLWGNLGAALEKLPDQEEKAREAFTRAIAMAEERVRVDTRTADDLARLAHYHASLDDREEALEFIERAREKRPLSPRVMYQIGYTYERLGDRDRAIEWMTKALEGGHPWHEIEREHGLRDLAEDEQLQDFKSTHHEEGSA